jgi:hypothetical protein
LTGKAKQVVDSYLQEHRTTLPAIAPYADQFDHTPEGSWAGPQHYVDMTDDAGEVNVEKCCKPFCVVTAIQNYTEIFATESTAPEDEKWFALEMITHFLGDVHMPLHVAYASDRGGNDIKVTFYGEPWNLHAVWDSAMIDLKYNNSYQELAKVIETEMTQDEEDGYRFVTDPVEMANEAFLLARMVAYPIPQDHALSEEYYDRNFIVVKKLLAMSGVRLGAHLNAMFNE